MSWRTFAVVASLTIVIARSVLLQESRRVTGFFTDMRYHKESGDVLGTEIFLTYSSSGTQAQHYAYVQFAEGSPEPPQLVPAEVNGNRIAFSLPEPNARLGKFVGVITRDSLIGKFDGTSDVLRLQRRSSYWR